MTKSIVLRGMLNIPKDRVFYVKDNIKYFIIPKFNNSSGCFDQVIFMYSGKKDSDENEIWKTSLDSIN